MGPPTAARAGSSENSAGGQGRCGLGQRGMGGGAFQARASGQDGREGSRPRDSGRRSWGSRWAQHTCYRHVWSALCRPDGGRPARPSAGWTVWGRQCRWPRSRQWIVHGAKERLSLSTGVQCLWASSTVTWTQWSESTLVTDHRGPIPAGAPGGGPGSSRGHQAAQQDEQRPAERGGADRK